MQKGYLAKYILLELEEDPLIYDDLIAKTNLKLSSKQFNCFIKGKSDGRTITQEVVKELVGYAFCVAFVADNDWGAAYKDLGDSHYLFIQKDNDGGYSVEVVNPSSDSDLAYHLEALFQGGAKNVIEPSLESLQKRYSVKKYTKYIVLSVVALVISGAALFVYDSAKPKLKDVNLSRAAVIPKQTPPPPPLSPKELRSMKNIANRYFLADLAERSIQIAASPTLKDKTKIAILEMRQSVSGQKLNVAVSYKMEFTFPAENTNLEGFRYTRTDEFKKTIERFVAKEQKTGYDVCIKEIMGQKTFKSTILERREDGVKFKFEDFKPSALFADMREITEKCDGYFENIRMADKNEATYFLSSQNDN